MEAIKQFCIELKSGDVLTVDVSEKLLSQIKKSFELSADDQVTDRHLKYFLVSSMNKALEAADVGENN